MQPEEQQMLVPKNKSKDMPIPKFMPLQGATCLQPFLANTIDKQLRQLHSIHMLMVFLFIYNRNNPL